MVQRNYSILESRVIDIIQREGRFTYQGRSYNALVVGKPRPQFGSGEPKTDVYILAEVNGDQREFKISVKSRSTNEFQENKVTPQRAEDFFGPDYQSIIEQTTRSISQRFSDRHLLFPNGKGATLPNSATVGWKLEIADKPRRLSAPLQLSERDAKDYIYKGTNLPDEKRNAVVNGQIFDGSGEAEYMLYAEIDDIQTSSDIFDNIELIDEVEFEPLYLIFTANNFRTDTGKTDGKRSLAVRVDWSVVGCKLVHTIAYDRPLAVTGKDQATNVRQALSQLGKQNVDELSPDDLVDPSILVL